MLMEGSQEGNRVHKRVDGANAEYRENVPGPSFNEQGTEPVTLLVTRNRLRSANFNFRAALAPLVIPKGPCIGRDRLGYCLLLFESVAECFERVSGGHCREYEGSQPSESIRNPCTSMGSPFKRTVDPS